ncbi:protein regulator of cytokinesis 1-like [Oppia nitens]|uniref:protein regulator of cytokinesis 1-like n=1 Tax=Oppia nitens TaxID=1686743 RepID=UPI0023DA78F5|nr:protein regulator of cytokinesis 1-like [Oppia nitens]
MNTTDAGLHEWLLKDNNESVADDDDLPQVFAKEAAKDIAEDTQQTVEKIATIWLQMGLTTSDMVDRIKQLKDLHFTANKNSLQIENSSLQRLIQYNDNKLKQINQILDDLTLPSFPAPTDRSLKQIGRILVYKYNELEALKKERLNQLTELKSKRDKLLATMNQKAKEFRTATNIPSDEELMQLQSYVSDLTKERSKRFNKYQSLKKIIEQLFVELEREVVFDFEKHLLFNDSENFILSDDHMKRLQSLHSELETCYQQNNDKRKQMEKRLQVLWDKLEVDSIYRNDFFRNKMGCKPSILSLLQQEVDKYEELKRQNLELFVQKVRNDLLEWYEKCFLSDEQKDKFQSFIDCNEYTEELLELHENELQKLQNYFEECEEMFDKLGEWHNLWNRYKELESKANDPNRFNNRGGALLAEEREKNQIKKNLPKVENILKKYSEDRLKLKGKLFDVFGIPVKQYLENLKMEYQDMKENEKKERQRHRQMEINGQLKSKKMTPVSGGVVVRKTPVKRALDTAPNCDSSNKVRRVGGPLTPSRVINDVNANTLTKRRDVAKPVPRARARNLENQMNQVLDTPNIDSILSIDEDQFQAPLTDRDNANSTFITFPNKPLTPSRNITKRREPKQQAMHRRLSRSCNDLSEAIDKQMHISNGRHLTPIRSTPTSPQVKSNYGYTPSRLPRINVHKHKPPFLL